MGDVQRLEAERLRPIPRIDPLTELFRKLIGTIAGLCEDAGMLPARSCPADCGGQVHDKHCCPQPERNTA